MCIYKHLFVGYYSCFSINLCRWSCASPDICINVNSILTFATEADTIPPTGFENDPEIQFDGDPSNPNMKLPTASTCGPTLHLPFALFTVEILNFTEKMDTSIVGAQCFGMP